MTLPLLALAWLFAVVAVGVWQAPPWVPAAALALLTPAAAAWRGRYGSLLVLVAAALALTGAVRFDAWLQREPPPLAAFAGQDVALLGHIDSEPDPGVTTSAYRFEVERIDAGAGWQETRGAVLLRVGQFADYLPGDSLLLEGEIEAAEAFDGFDYRGYLLRQGIVGTMLYPRITPQDDARDWSFEREVVQARLALDASLQRALPEPEASLAAGIVFGRDGNMSPELYDAFRDSGLAHIVAVSGSNVALVAVLTFAVLRLWVGRRAATVPAAVAIGIYVMVVGFEPSVVRSALMAGVALFGLVVGRPQSGLSALGAAAIVMMALDPGIAVSAGFQLSLAATAGLIALGPWLHHGFERALARVGLAGLVPRVLTLAAAYSLAATIATLPLVWVLFGRVSLVGPLANVVIEPLFAVAFWLSAGTAVVGLVSERAAWVLGLAAYYPLGLTVWLAETSAALPGAAFDVPRPGGTVAVAAYAVLILAAWPAYRLPAPDEPPGGYRRRGVRALAVAGAAGGLAIAVWFVSLAPLARPGELEVAILDVGQGDAVLVTTPGGQRLLIDGGPSGIVLARELGELLPHWRRDIEAVLLSHPQEDHLAGLAALFERFQVDRVYESGATNTTESYNAYLAGAPERQQLAAGDAWAFDGVDIEVLWPPEGYASDNRNDHSLVLRLTYGETDILLTGDIEAPPQRDLLAAGIVAADVLKVPHHGSATSLPEFLAATAGEWAVISAGADNRFGHPRDETLAALAGAYVLRTDMHGRITIRSDGEEVRVSVERE